MSLTAAHLAFSTIQPRLVALLYDVDEQGKDLASGVFYGQVPTPGDVSAFTLPWVVYTLSGTPDEDFEHDRMNYTLTIGVNFRYSAGGNALQLAALAAVRDGLSRWQSSAWPTGVTGSQMRQTEDAGRAFDEKFFEDGLTFEFWAEVTAPDHSPPPETP